MPKVPSYENFQVMPTAGPAPSFSAPRAPGPGAVVADQASRLGQSLMGAGGEVAKLQLEANQQANLTRINDAANKAQMVAQDLAYNPETGFMAKQGANAFLDQEGKPLPTPLASDYGQKLQDSLSEIRTTLANDEQRRNFDRVAGNLQANFHGQIERHVGQQFGAYKDATADGTVAVVSNGAKLNWDNPTYILGGKDPNTGEYTPGEIDKVKAAIMEKAQRAGMTGMAAEKAIQNGVSGIHTGVVMMALQNGNPKYASDYMAQAKARGEMTGDDLLKLQGHVNTATWTNQANTAVQQATTAVMPAIAPSAMDRMAAITAQTESGNRDFAKDGSLLQGPTTRYGTAKGSMQVLDGTAQDPGFGVKPAQDNSAAERARVGRDYLHALVQRYDGDPAKAWAAYNAGPGVVDKALKGSAAGSGVDWLSSMPKETQAYVQKNLAALQKGGTPAPRPTELEFVNNAIAALGQNPDPQAVKITREAAATQFTIINKTLTEKGDNALADAQRWVAQNTGAPLERMPAPLVDALTQYAPGKLDDLRKFHRAMVTPDEVKTNLSRYNDVVTDMGRYARMSDAGWDSLQSELNPTDFKALSKQRQEYRTGAGSTSPGGINREAVNRSVDMGLQALKIDTHPKTSDTASQERLGAIRDFVDRSIFDAQRASGKKMTAEEIDTHVHKLFATDVKFKRTVFGFSADSSEKLMSMEFSGLPPSAKDGLRQSLIAQGNKNPTDTDILNLYRRLHVQQ